MSIALPFLIFLGTCLVLALGRPPVFRIDRTGAAIVAPGTRTRHLALAPGTRHSHPAPGTRTWH